MRAGTIVPADSDCTRDHWAGEVATGSEGPKKVDLLRSSPSSSSESEVVDWAGDGCLRTVRRDELEVAGGFMVVGNNEGSTCPSGSKRCAYVSASYMRCR